MADAKQVFLERVMNHRFNIDATTRKVDAFADANDIWGVDQSRYHQEWLFGTSEWSLPRLSTGNKHPLTDRLTVATHTVTTAHAGASTVTNIEVNEILAVIRAFRQCFNSSGDIWPGQNPRDGYDHYDAYTMVRFKLDWIAPPAGIHDGY